MWGLINFEIHGLKETLGYKFHSFKKTFSNCQRQVILSADNMNILYEIHAVCAFKELII